MIWLIIGIFIGFIAGREAREPLEKFVNGESR